MPDLTPVNEDPGVVDPSCPRIDRSASENSLGAIAVVQPVSGTDEQGYDSFPELLSGRIHRELL